MLPNIKEIINRNWRILSIDSMFKEIFNNLQPIIAIQKLKTTCRNKRNKKQPKNFSHPHKQQPQVNVPRVTPVNHFAASKFSKRQHLFACGLKI